MKTLKFLFLSGMFRALQEITAWRDTWSWIPVEFFRYRGAFNIDPYHFATTLHWMFMFAAGFSFVISMLSPLFKNNPTFDIWKDRERFKFFLIFTGLGNLVIAAALWLIHGMFSNLFFHFVFMKPENWFK